MTIQEAEKIIEKNNQMCRMLCTCNRLGICQRCVIEVSLPKKIVEEAYRVYEKYGKEI